MFKKIHRQLERKREGRVPLKFRFDVQIVQVSNLPPAVNECRVVWSRGPKIQMTRVEPAVEGEVQYHQTLTQVATIYRANTYFESKEYSFTIQAPSKKPGTDKMVTLGRTNVNLAEYTSLESTEFNVDVPVEFQMGNKRNTVIVSTIISSSLMKGIAPGDAMTEVSGLSGFTSMTEMNEQDLAGFYAESSSIDSSDRTSSLQHRGGASVPDISSGGSGSGSGSVDSHEEFRSIRPTSRMLGRVDEEAESLVHNAIEELEHRHAEEKRSWEKEKTRFLDIRLSLEEELTRVNAEQDDLRGQAESLSTELEQVKRNAEKQKSKMTKELANMRQLSLDALKEADLKIQNIESKLAKEREDHRNQVKFLKEDAEQLSRQLVYEKSAVEEERRNFMMAKQQWNGMKQALELEIESMRNSMIRFDSDASEMEFNVGSVKGSMDHEKEQPMLTITERSLSASPTILSVDQRTSSIQALPPRSPSAQMNISNISRLESDNAELKFRLSDYKTRVEGLQRNLQVSLRGVNDAQTSCEEAAEKIKALEAERDQLIEQLESTRRKLNNLEPQSDGTHQDFCDAQGNIEELEVKRTHLEQVVQSLEGELQMARLDADKVSHSEEVLLSQLKECRALNEDLESKNGNLTSDNTQLAKLIVDLESRLKGSVELAQEHEASLDETRRELEEKEVLLAVAQDELEECERNLKKARKGVKNVESKLTEKVSELEEANACLASKDAEINDLKKHEIDLTQQLEHQVSGIKEQCDVKLNEALAEKKTILDRKSTLEAKVALFQGELDKLGNSLTSELEDVKRKLIKSEDMCRMLELDRNSLQGLIDAKEEMVSLLEAEVAGLRESVEEIRNELRSKESALEISCLNISDLEGQLKGRNSAEEKLQGLVEEMERKNATLIVEKESLLSSIEELKGKLLSTESTCSQISEELKEKDSANESHLQKIADLETMLVSAQAESEEKEQLERRLSQVQEAGQVLEKSLVDSQDADRQIVSLKEHLESAEATSRDAKDTIASLNDQISYLEEERKSWNTRWDAQVDLVSRVPELEALVESLQKANQGLERSISRKKKDIESLQSELNDLKMHMQNSGEHTRLNLTKEVVQEHPSESDGLGIGKKVREMKRELVALEDELLQITSSRDQLTSEKAGLQDSLKEEYLSRQETEEKLEKANKLKSDLESQLADHALKLCYAEKSLSHLKEEMQAKVESANQGDSHDSEQIMQELVVTKIAMAEMQERDIVTRRDLYKSKEYNMKLASKMTKLEALLYSKQTSA